MKIYYKDIINDKDEWSHLEIQVDEDVKPTLRLYAGGKHRFKLASSNRVYFWGNIEEGYYGAWTLYNPSEIQLSDMPISPIKADTVQAAPNKMEERLSFWSKYFTKSIANSENSLFHKGKWKISSKLPLKRLLQIGFYSKKQATEIQQGFYETNPLYLDWGFNGNFTVIAIKKEPDAETSRVKRWRKEVRNGNCPPVLVWYVSCLSAYVILDGHCRLKAFHCEDEVPDIMVLESIIEHDRIPDLKSAESIMQKNIETRQKHQWKPPMTVQAINKLLISVFDNRPFNWTISKSTAKSGFEEEWTQEVNGFENKKDINQAQLEDMIKG